MKTSVAAAIAAFFVVLGLAGCGAPKPEHAEQPISERPKPAIDFKSLSKEEKIKYIQSSKAPDTEKQRAIGEVNAGRL